MDERLLGITIKSFELFLPQLKEIIEIMNNNNGSFPLQEEYLAKIPTDKVINWAILYVNPALAKGIPALAILGDERIAELANEIRVLQKNGESLDRLSINEEIFIAISQELLEEEEDLASLNSDEFIAGLMSSLPLVFNFQAVMTHGRTMFNLVERAKNGDDNAFCDAVQIDRTVLYGIPYFSNRLLRIQLSNDDLLKKKLANAIKGKIHSPKRRHPLLWFFFAGLHDAGFLDLPLAHLMKLCEQLNIYGYDTNHDLESLRKLRQEFRKKTGDQI